MKKDKKLARCAVTALAALALLAGCGEGGGEADNPAPPPPAPPPTFSIGGTLNGLAGTGLVLQNNSGDDLAVTTAGTFTFAGRLAGGSAYSVTIKTQPTAPNQLCSVASGSGTIAAANVTNVAVTCVAPLFTVGGAVAGLNGTLVMQNNAGDDLTLSANGPFVFANALVAGANYSVSIKTQPAGQTCTVSNGSGVASAANISNVGVSCSSALAVTSTTPADNSAGVAREGPIVIEFSADVDPATVNDTSITLSTAGGARAVTFVVSGHQVTLVPDGKLALAAKHTLLIKTNVRGANGETLADAVTRTFRVRDGQWGAPKLLQTGTSGSYPQIGFDASGNAIAVWNDSTNADRRLAARRYHAGADWEAATFMDVIGTSNPVPRLAVDGAGNATVIWSEYRDVNDWRVLAARNVSDAWQPEVLLGTSVGVGLLMDVAANARGEAIAVWEEFDGAGYTVWSRRFSAAAWQDEEKVATNAAGDMGPQVAIDADGNAIATYRLSRGIFYDGWARRYAAGTGWEMPALIENEDSSANIIPIVFDPSGNAIAVWTQGTANFGHSSIWANRCVAGGTWGQATLLEHDDIAPGSAPQVAVDARGDAIVAWPHSDLSRAATDIWANHYVADADWEGEELIETQRKGNANFQQVAMDPAGNAIAVWKENDGSRDNVWTNRYVAGPGWGTAQLLETSDGWAWDPQIAIDADGNAFAIWSQFNGTSMDVFVSRFE